MKTTVPLKLLLIIGFALFGIKSYSQRGNALNLAENNQYLYTPDNDKSLKSYTIEAWVYWRANDPNAVQFLCGKDIEQMEIHFGGIGDNGIRFIPTPGVYVDALAAMPTNEWVHLAVTYNYDDAVAKIYINGIEKASNSISLQEIHTEDYFKIGTRANATYFLNAMVDEFRLWNTARTAKEIRENMHLTLHNSTPNLLQYFQFNEGLGATTIADTMGGNAGAIVGANLVASTANVGTGFSATRENPAANTEYGFSLTDLWLRFGNAPNGDVVVSRIKGKPAGTQVNGSNVTTFDDYYWIVDNYGTNTNNLNITASFYFDDAKFNQFISGAVAANMKLNQRNTNTLGAWTETNQASHLFSSSYSVRFTGVGSMSEVVLSKNLTVLPVTLVNFTAKADGNRAKLQWRTANEVNHKGFEIYRSGDDGKFVKIGEVNSSSGSQTTPNVSRQMLYTFTDNQPLNGANYYKLMQVDNDGKATELGIRMVNFGLPTYNIQLFPNPTTDIMTTSFISGTFSQLEVVDFTGKVFQKIGITEKQTEATISLAGYPTGIYLVKLSGKGLVESKKVIKN